MSESASDVAENTIRYRIIITLKGGGNPITFCVDKPQDSIRGYVRSLHRDACECKSLVFVDAEHDHGGSISGINVAAVEYSAV